ncbi:MAG: ABC transporter substrate-binding protein [Frankia sp.]
MRLRAPARAALAVLGIAALLAGCGSSGGSSTAAAAPTSSISAACAAVQAKFPTVAGKHVSVGIAPTIPGYETIDPKDPNKIVGFDVDLLKAVASCAGFSYSFSRADFQTLVPSLQAGRIDMVISNLIASPARAEKVNFVIYQKDEEALIVAHNNPKKITEVDALCGNSLAVFPGTVQAGAAQTQSAACVAGGRKAIKINTYTDFNGCLQGVLTGRSDAFINPVSVVKLTVAKYPTKLSATAPIAEFRSLIGMAFNKSNPQLRDAAMAALQQVQSTGKEEALFTAWKQDPGDQATASLLP